MYTIYHSEIIGTIKEEKIKLIQIAKNVKNWCHKTHPNYKNSEKLNIFLRFF
jgi:hypothetical protein